MTMAMAKATDIAMAMEKASLPSRPNKSKCGQSEPKPSMIPLDGPVDFHVLIPPTVDPVHQGDHNDARKITLLIFLHFQISVSAEVHVLAYLLCSVFLYICCTLFVYICIFCV